jgi:hypothetical protein
VFNGEVYNFGESESDCSRAATLSAAAATPVDGRPARFHYAYHVLVTHP